MVNGKPRLAYISSMYDGNYESGKKQECLLEELGVVVIIDKC
jgi:hypothetical protein